MKDKLAIETIEKAHQDLQKVRKAVQRMQNEVGRQPIHNDDDVSRIFLEIKKLVSATSQLDKMMKEFGSNSTAG